MTCPIEYACITQKINDLCDALDEADKAHWAGSSIACLEKAHTALVRLKGKPTISLIILGAQLDAQERGGA